MELASKGQLRAALLRRAAVTVPLIVLLGFLSGRLVPVGSENCWYVALTKPSATPPDWAFPVAWTTIYVLMGLALALVWNARGSATRGLALGLFAGQLVANLAWTPLFFGARQPVAALVLIGVMLVLAIVTTVAFARIRRAAAWLLVPYLVWTSFAGVLTWRIVQLNPDAANIACGGASTQIAL